jgi:pyruvate ferredoxin oxidoreductase gamma subunit
VLRDEIYNPDYVVVMDPSLIGIVSVEAGLKDGGMIVANYPDSADELRKILNTQAEVVTINATKLAMEELGRPITNTAMVGAFVGASNLIKLDTLKETIVEWFKNPKLSEKNVKLVETAYNMVKEG